MIVETAQRKRTSLPTPNSTQESVNSHARIVPGFPLFLQRGGRIDGGSRQNCDTNALAPTTGESTQQSAPTRDAAPHEQENRQGRGLLSEEREEPLNEPEATKAERSSNLLGASTTPAGVQLPASPSQHQDATEQHPANVTQGEAPALAAEQPAVQNDAASNTPAADPLVLRGSVGARGANSPADVAKVQTRLVALGLLSEESFAAESLDSTTTLSDGTAITVSESSLQATIAAIREFQRTLFGKEIVDGNIGPSGPTWRSLSTIDAATYAEIKRAWETKKQQIEQERDRQRQLEAEHSQEEERQRSQEAEERRTKLPHELLAKYAKFIPYTNNYFALQESDLAHALTSYAKTDGEVVLKVFELLYDGDRDDVAYELSRKTIDTDLAAFDTAVLGCFERGDHRGRSYQSRDQRNCSARRCPRSSGRS